jgi:hypothetical protein
MHPELLQLTIDERRRELERRSRSGELRRRVPESAEPAGQTAVVVLRLCSVHDDAALDRLAELESRPLPSGRHVIAEVDGTVVAALPLGQGPVLADPFERTEHLIPLLELRARQIAPETHRRGPGGWGLARRLSRA